MAETLTTERDGRVLTVHEPCLQALVRGGLHRSDVETAYPEWKVTDEEPFDVVSGARFYRHIRTADPRVYRLRRE